MAAQDLLEQDFAPLGEVIRAHARERGAKPALIQGDQLLGYGDLDLLMDRVVAALNRDGVGSGDAVALCAATSLDYLAVMLGAVRAGVSVAPLAPSGAAESLDLQVRDSGASVLFIDSTTRLALAAPSQSGARRLVSLDGGDTGQRIQAWLARPGADFAASDIRPEQAFSVIYSSGTTGEPKGIVQPHQHRWNLVRRGLFPEDAITLVSTPLYSHTTLLPLLSTLAHGGTVVLMEKFNCREFLALSQAHRVTHAMLVPVQYQRLMDDPAFEAYDLSSYRMKFCTSAPFATELKRAVVTRWPGGLTEFYGLSEGGGSCGLAVHEHPGKLHTVGRPLPGHDIRLIDEDGNTVGAGAEGEIVGRSGTMMTGYQNRPDLTAAAEWWSPEGLRFIRTGDIGRFDEDGFLVLLGRRKDMINSGGFNIYPSDIEAVIAGHDAIAEAAVIGAPSAAWGETPVGFVSLHPGHDADTDTLLHWANARLGKVQRLSDLVVVEALPRSEIGKVLKRDLRERYRPRADA